eukprot:1519388-Rhodomonas_salina.1
MIEGYDKLADVNILEQNPSNLNEAMHNVRLRPFWMDSENKEMDGLWKRCCFKRWKRSDLLTNYRVCCSSFHYNIKCDGATRLITNCKVQLVVMGNRMKEGKDYVDSFTPVPHATSGCIVISLAAVMDLELHSCNLAQAFIQEDKLDEGVNSLLFMRPLQGATDDDGVVYEVLGPLYGIPSSARALHLTLSK